MMNNDEQQYPIFPSQGEALIIILITMLLTFFAGIVAVTLGFKRTELLFVEVLTIVPAVIFVYKKKFSPKLIFRLRSININILLASIFIGLALTVLADEVDRLIQLIFPMPEIILKAIEETLIIRSLNDFFVVIISAVLLAAICEELLFRGFLQTCFENTFDITKAVMITSLIFAIVHFNPWWTIQLILFGVFLGVLAWKSNSIIPSIIVHLINNGVALIFTNLGESNFQWYYWKNHVNPSIILLAGITLFFGLKKFYRYCDEFNNQQFESKNSSH